MNRLTPDFFPVKYFKKCTRGSCIGVASIKLGFGMAAVGIFSMAHCNMPGLEQLVCAFLSPNAFVKQQYASSWILPGPLCLALLRSAAIISDIICTCIEY